MTVEAFFSDLDGTFWAPDMKVHPNTLAAVDALDQHDLPFVIATGRRAKGSYQGLEPYGLHQRPAILMNGAQVRPRLDGQSIAVVDIAQPGEVLALFEEHGLEPAMYVDDPDNDMVVGAHTAAREVYLNSTIGFVRVPDLRSAIDAATVVGFGAFGFDYDVLAPIADKVNASGLASAVIGISHIEGGYGIMVQAANVNKQVGMSAWCKANGIEATNVAAIGDGHNDIEMLDAAAIAIVPNNAPPEIREIADHLISPNEEGGWEEIPSILGLA